MQGRCPQEAIAAARRAVELEPQQPYLREHLVALLMEAGIEADAEAALRDALERHPDRAALHFHHSRLWRRRGHPAAALGAARRAVELEPERGRWRDHLAALLSEAGRLETPAPPRCTTEGASILEFPAARSGRGLDGIAVDTTDRPIPTRGASPEHRAPQRGSSAQNLPPGAT